MAAENREAARRRLNDLVAARERGVFTFERLHELAGPVDRVWLAKALATMVNEGMLEQFVRVESPHGSGGIGDYRSFLDVPSHIHDRRTDTELVVTPENLRLFYRVVARP